MNFNLPLTEAQGTFLFRLLNGHVSGPGAVDAGIVDILDTLVVNLPGDEPLTLLPFSKHPFTEDGVLFLDKDFGQPVDLQPAQHHTVIAGERKKTDFHIGLDLPEMEILQRALARVNDDPDMEGVYAFREILNEAIGPLEETYEVESKGDVETLYDDGAEHEYGIHVNEKQLRLILRGLVRSYENGDDNGNEIVYVYSAIAQAVGMEEEVASLDTWMCDDDCCAGEDEDNYDGDEYRVHLTEQQFQALGSILSWHIAGSAVYETGLIDLQETLLDMHGKEEFEQFRVGTAPTIWDGKANWIVLEKE